MVLPADCSRDKGIKIGFALALVIDLPVTALLAAIGLGGVIRVLAQKPSVKATEN